MKLSKILSLALAVIMVVAIIPAAALADVWQQEAAYRKMWNDTDEIWAEIESVDAEMTANGDSEKEILNALYAIAAEGEGVVSCTWEDDNSFSFVHESGMINAYDREVNHPDTAIAHDGTEDYFFTTLERDETASSLDAILLGPYYGYDSSFTAQYREEVAAVAAVTGGNSTIYSGANVDANACKAIGNYGTIFFDSHGSTASGKSWLCTNSGVGYTNEDYTAQRALRSGSAAWVTGTFWEYYCPDMKDSFVWMAICLGMNTNTMAIPLMNAGCKAVYGYSQSVTFSGDYAYSRVFWNRMKAGDTIAEALDVMKAQYGVPDPYGNAYPIVVSEVDDYPANPDAAQNVYCEWRLPNESDLVITDATAVSFTENSFGIAPLFTHAITATIAPEGANNFVKTWRSSDETVATVDRKGVVTGISAGTATVTLTVTSTAASNTSYEYSASATVTVDNYYLPADVVYVPTTTIVAGEKYVIGYSTSSTNAIMTNVYYDSNNGRSLKTEAVTVGKLDGVDCITSTVNSDYDVVFSAANGGQIRFVNSGLYLNVTGAANNYLCMAATGAAWTWTVNEDNASGTMQIPTAASFKYLGVTNSGSYFGMFITGYNLTLYRKLTREVEPPTPPTVMGDANGDGVITTADALLVMRYTLGSVVLSPDALALSDFNGDGRVDTTDALLILRRTIGL